MIQKGGQVLCTSLMIWSHERWPASAMAWSHEFQVELPRCPSGFVWKWGTPTPDYHQLGESFLLFDANLGSTSFLDKQTYHQAFVQRKSWCPDMIPSTIRLSNMAIENALPLGVCSWENQRTSAGGFRPGHRRGGSCLVLYAKGTDDGWFTIHVYQYMMHVCIIH